MSAATWHLAAVDLLRPEPGRARERDPWAVDMRARLFVLDDHDREAVALRLLAGFAASIHGRGALDQLAWRTALALNLRAGGHRPPQTTTTLRLRTYRDGFTVRSHRSAVAAGILLAMLQADHAGPIVPRIIGRALMLAGIQAHDATTCDQARDAMRAQLRTLFAAALANPDHDQAQEDDATEA